MLVELGVINGKDDGTYDPTGIVTRAEMAKMICVVLNGGKDPSLGSTVTNSYTDTVGHWAAGYIEYCTQLGIVAGDGAGKFNPNATVTGSEAAKMLLVAMGYKSEVEGFTGANWAIAVNVRANQKGLYSDLSIAVDTGLSRDNAAQMIYNALDAGIVSYDYTLVTDGSTISSSPTLIDNNSKTLLEHAFNAVKVEGVVIANEYANLNATSEKGSALDAGETRLDVTNYGSEEDQTDFNDGVYSVSTSLDMLGKSVTLYVKKDASSTSKATILGNAITSEDNVVVTKASNHLISKIASDNDLDLDNAVVVTNYTQAVDYADYDDDAKVRGVEKVLIDNDDDGEVEYVLVNTWYFGQVSKYSTKDDGSITIDIAKAWNKSDLSHDDSSEIVGFEDVAEDDYVLAAWIGGKLYVEKAESVTGVLDAIKPGETMTVDGTKYDVSEVVAYEGGDDEITAATKIGSTYLDNEGTFYLDKNGMIVAVGNVAENAYDFAYVWAYDDGNAPFDDARVKVTLSDGTTKVYTLDKVVDANNKSVETVAEGAIYAYSINSDDEIKLTEVKTDESFAPGKFTKGSTRVGTGDGTYYATSNTVFFYVTLKDNEVDGVDVYTGYQSAPSLDAAAGDGYIALNNSGRATAVAYADEDIKTAEDVSDHLYITDVVDETSDYTTVTAVLAGTDEEVEIKVDSDDLTAAQTGLYLYSVGDDDVYSLDSNVGEQYITVDDVADHVSGTTLVIGDNEYALTDDTVLIELDGGNFDTAWTGRLPASDDHIEAILVDDADDGDLLMIIIDNGTDEEPADEPTEGTGVVSGATLVSSGSAISSEIAASGWDALFADKGASVAEVVSSLADTKVAYADGVITVTGTIVKNGGFNELYGEDAEDAYYLVLSMKAPADFEAVKATLGNGNAADVNDGTFTLIQKVADGDYEKTIEITWADKDGNTVKTTTVLDMYGLEKTNG